MTDVEESPALSFCRGERAPAGNRLIHQFVESQTLCTPDAIAVVCGDHFCSYAALEERAEDIAAELRRRGMPIESRIGVFVRRRIEMVAALLGILKSGAAYVPLDPSYPTERFSTIIRDFGLKCVITERAALNDLADHGVENIFIEDVIGSVRSCHEETAAGSLPEEPRRLEPDSTNLAYVIEFGEDILFSLGMSPKQFSEEAKFLLAAKLYELGKLSSGQAARLCGKRRVDFLMSLTRIGIPVSNLQPDDAQIEIDFARHG